MMPCLADDCLPVASNDDVVEAVDLLHAVARGALRDASPALRRIVLGDAAAVDAISALAAG